MLKSKGVNLKLISDIENYRFIESVIGSGISMIFKAYSEANNEFLKSYNPSKPSTHIVYSDANKLYGHTMMQLFPIEILDWVNPEKK